MKPILIFLLMTAFLSAASLPTLDETSYSRTVAAQKGKVVLVNFWATWCEPCRAEMPQLVKLAAKLRPKGFQLITVSADEPEQEGAAFQLLQKNGVAAPYYRKQARNDDQFINALDPKWSGALPALFLYDKSGRKVKSFFGETDLAALEAAIQKLL